MIIPKNKMGTLIVHEVLFQVLKTTKILLKELTVSILIIMFWCIGSWLCEGWMVVDWSVLKKALLEFSYKIFELTKLLSIFRVC